MNYTCTELSDYCHKPTIPNNRVSHGHVNALTVKFQVLYPTSRNISTMDSSAQTYLFSDETTNKCNDKYSDQNKGCLLFAVK